MLRKFSTLAMLVALSLVMASYNVSNAWDWWSDRADAIKNSSVGGVVGGVVNQLPKWDPTNPKSDLNAYLESIDPGSRINTEAKRTGRKFGEGLIEGAKPGIDLLIDGAGKKVLALSDEVNADILATGQKLIGTAETSAGKLLLDGENAANRIIMATFQQADETILKGAQAASSVIERAMDRQAGIVDTSLNRIEDISEDALTRIESLQADSMARIEAAISDQVPFTASTLFAQAEAFVLIITVAGLLLGAIVFYLKEDGAFKRTMKEPFNLKLIWKRSVEALAIGSRVILRFGPPLFASALIVHLGYMWHYSSTQSSRVGRLNLAAQEAINAGDFLTAASFRARVCRLSPQPKFIYDLKRDSFLAKYFQGHKRLSEDEIFSGIVGLLNADPKNEFFKEDIETLCVLSYEASKGSAILTNAFVEAAARTIQENGTKITHSLLIPEIKDNLVELKKDGKALPFSGKLVFLAAMRLALGESTTSTVHKRIKSAEEIGTQLLDCYPNYSVGLHAASMIAFFRRQSTAWFPDPHEDFLGLNEDAITESINAEMNGIRYVANLAIALDPLISQIVWLEREVAPKELVESFNEIDTLSKTEPAKADAAREKLSRDPIFNSYVQQLIVKASKVYGNGPIARLFAEKCAVQAIERGQKTALMIGKIDIAKTLLEDEKASMADQYRACLAAAADALFAEQPYVAERWLTKANTISVSGPTRNSELVDGVSKALQRDLVREVCRILD